MHRRLVAVAALATVSLSGTALAKKPPSSDWDPAVGAALKTMAEKMFADMDAANTDAMGSSMSAGAIVFDIDPDGKPVAKRGAEVMAYMTDITKGMKDAGGSMKSTVSSLDCFGTAVMGYCVTEFSQMFTMGGETMGPMKFRGTLVARLVGEEWKWEHWHGSFAEMPAPPAPPPPAPAEMAPAAPAAPAPAAPAAPAPAAPKPK